MEEPLDPVSSANAGQTASSTSVEELPSSEHGILIFYNLLGHPRECLKRGGSKLVVDVLGLLGSEWEVVFGKSSVVDLCLAGVSTDPMNKNTDFANGTLCIA